MSRTRSTPAEKAGPVPVRTRAASVSARAASSARSARRNSRSRALTGPWSNRTTVTLRDTGSTLIISAPPSVGDRQPAVLAECLGRHPDPGWGLAPLVLAQVDEPGDPPNRRRVVPGGFELGYRPVTFNVTLQDGVEHVVGRKRVGVDLAWRQLGRRRLLQHVLRDPDPVAVAPPGQAEDQGLLNVLQGGEAAGHVAVEGRVAGGHLALAP